MILPHRTLCFGRPPPGHHHHSRPHTQVHITTPDNPEESAHEADEDIYRHTCPLLPHCPTDSNIALRSCQNFPGSSKALERTDGELNSPSSPAPPHKHQAGTASTHTQTHIMAVRAQFESSNEFVFPSPPPPLTVPLLPTLPPAKALLTNSSLRTESASSPP